MTETVPDLPPVRRSRRTAIAVAALAALIAGVGGGGYLIGHRTAPESKATPVSAACAAAAKSFNSEIQAASAGSWSAMDDAGQQHMRVGAHVALQNPTCFNPTTVAAAQTMLDDMELKNVRDSVNSGVKCDPDFSRLC